MKKALTQIVYGQTNSVTDNLAAVKKWGYEGFELLMTDKTDLNLNATATDYKRLREASQKAGVAFTSICISGTGKYTLADDDPKVRESRKVEIRKAIEAAAALGIDCILVVPAWANEKIQYDVAYDRIIAELKSLALVAEKAKVNLGIEPVWNKLFVSPLDMKNAIDAVGSERVGCFFDVANFLFWSYPQHWIRILGGKRIKKIHFKDFKAERAKDGEFNMTLSWPQLMDGQVNWPEVMRAIREIGYNDFVISEVGGDDATYAETSKRMDKILKM